MPENLKGLLFFTHPIILETYVPLRSIDLLFTLHYISLLCNNNINAKTKAANTAITI